MFTLYPPTVEHTKKSNHKRLYIVSLTSLVIVAIGVNAVFWINNQGIVTSGSASSSVLGQNKTTERVPETVNFIPDETPPGENFEWTGIPNHPKKFTLNSINVSGYIENVAVDINGEIAVPSNIHVAGWFEETVLPGEDGLSVIDGHVSGITTDGIFAQLHKMKIGDTITIEFGDGTKKQFEVFDTVIIKKEDTTKELFSQSIGIRSQVNYHGLKSVAC